MLYNVRIEQDGFSTPDFKYTARGNVMNLYDNTTAGILLVRNGTIQMATKDVYTRNQINFVVPDYSDTRITCDKWLHLLKEPPLAEQFSKNQAPLVCLCEINESQISAPVILELGEIFKLKLVICDCTSSNTERVFHACGWCITKPLH